MARVPLYAAIFLELLLICCHNEFEQPDVWITIGINAVFIVFSIIKAFYSR